MGFGVPGEMIFLFLLVLILFGPKKMPEIGRQVARVLNELRRASNEFRSQIESEVNSLDVGNHSQQPILPRLQAPLGSLANRIFNPPSAEKRVVAENAPAENDVTVEHPAAGEMTLVPSPPTGVEPQKVAPDA